MTRWYREEGRQKASDQTRAILDEIERKLALHKDPRALVTSIRTGPGTRDEHDFEVEIDLVPGAMLAFRYGHPDDEEQQTDLLESEDEDVAWLAAATVKAYQTHGSDALADLLHDMRIRTRKTVVGWLATGVYVTLVDIRLVRGKWWGTDDYFTVEIRLRCLGRNLQVTIDALTVSHPHLLEDELSVLKSHQADRFEAKRALALHGADGMIDKLAFNAIAQQGDVATALRAIAAELYCERPAQLTISIYHGHVQCRGRSSDGNFAWDHSAVTIYGQTVPETVALRLRGEPLTQLVTHPVLSDDMIITQISSTVSHGVHLIHAEFEQPRLLFCSASGRVWQSAGVWARTDRNVPRQCRSPLPWSIGPVRPDLYALEFSRMSHAVQAWPVPRTGHEPHAPPQNKWSRTDARGRQACPRRAARRAYPIARQAGRFPDHAKR